MANLTPEFVSNFVRDQFPEAFQDNNSALVDFVLAYYEWLETTGQTTKVLRQLRSNRDIDDTVDNFVVHFKDTFLNGAPLDTYSDTRFLIKHVSDIYQSKGTPRSINLLIKMLYGEEAAIFLPSERILKPSDSVWRRPLYLELSNSVRNKSLAGKYITGATTASSGFVESVVTKLVAKKRVTIAYLSEVSGDFEFGELITDDGNLENAPVVIGSLSTISINNGGQNNQVGDIFNIISPTGRGGRAKVLSIADEAGRVNFTLANGGYGYTVSNTYTDTLASNATFIVNNVTSANDEIDFFFQFEDLQQPIQTITVAGVGSNNEDRVAYLNEFLTQATNASYVNNFLVIEGGTGYTNADTLSFTTGNAEATVVTSNTGEIVSVTVDNPGSGIDSTPRFEIITAEGTGANLKIVMGNDFYVKGANVYGNSAINSDNVASGYIVSSNVATGNGSATLTMQIIPTEGSFLVADRIYAYSSSNNETTKPIDTAANNYTRGEYINYRYNSANNTYTLGLNANTGNIYSGPGAFVRGTLSNVHANVTFVGTGSSADFEVGALGESETLSIFTDLIGGNNTQDVPYVDVLVDASNSQIGFIDSITIDTQLSVGNVSNLVNQAVAANGGFAVGQYVFHANLYVNSIFMVSGGSGYSNSDTVVFSSLGETTAANASIITHANGTINYWVLDNQGADYDGQPTISITTSGGSGANLIAIMGAEGKGAHGYIKAVNSTAVVVNKIANGSFSSNTTLTNRSANAFANITSVDLMGGGNYLIADTITISNGSPTNTATATVFVNAASNGGFIESFTVTDPGVGFEFDPTGVINTSTGSGVSFTINMDYGYGLPKSSQADLTTILADALTFATFTIGEIATIGGINPGQGYNFNPVTVAHNPYIAGYNRRDIVCIVTDVSGLFKINEQLRQTVSNPGYVVTHSNSTSNGISLYNNTAITLGEGVRQLTTNATGVVSVSNSTSIKLINTVGAFDDSYDIITLTSNATITPLTAGVVEVPTEGIATGRFKSIVNNDDGTSEIRIRRLSFAQPFVPGVPLTGQTTGVTANVQYAYDDDNTLPIGLNAVVTANVLTANGVATNLEIINSGYGYEQGAPLTLTRDGHAFVITGNTVLTKQGIADGRWLDSRSFISDTSRIQDSNYYQEFSYVVQTGIALDKYSEILTQMLHVAGTKLFGEVKRVNVVHALNITGEHTEITAANNYESWMG